MSGLGRDVSMAYLFGSDPAIAAFLVAFRWANVLRRLFGEGALLTSFVPHFESARVLEPRSSAVFFRDTFFSLSAVLLLVIALAEALLGFSREFFGPANRQIISLTMTMLPGLLFICLGSLCSGLLQCEKRYFLTGAAPIAFNLVWIAAIWIFKDWIPFEAVRGLSIAIVGAYALQWLVTMPGVIEYLRRYLSWRDIWRGRCFTAEMRGMIASISLGIIGVGAAQINSAIDVLFARYASLEGPAYLNYAIHLQQLPLALFGIAIASALLPSLSRALDESHYHYLLTQTISKTMLLLVPCFGAILFLGSPGINFIYGHGNFSQIATWQTLFCLWGYGWGLIPMALAILLAPAFHARKDFATPTKAACLAIALNIALNVLFVVLFQWETAALALATSLGACFNAGYLLWKLPISEKKGIFSFPLACKALISTLGAGIAALAVSYYFQDPAAVWLFGMDAHFSRELAVQGAHLSSCACAFASICILLMRILCVL
jgi:putative peptidoglycan lipid II flippase